MAPFNPNNTIRGVRRPNLEVQGGYLSLKGSTFQISNIDKMNMKSEMLVGREGRGRNAIGLDFYYISC